MRSSPGRAAVFVGVATFIAIGMVAWSSRAYGLRSAWFALVVVWVPMTWLGTIGRVVRPKLPACYHALRGFERSGRVYEVVGIRLVKRMLRRGPLSWFNPDLHLPSAPTPASIERLDRRMRDAEASHCLLFVATLAIVIHAAGRGWWRAAGWTLLFNVLLNGYPVMLQRYNRALLHLRFRRTPGDRARRSRR